MRYDCDFDAVILADGSFPTDRRPLGVLDGASYLCCCDSAGMTMVDWGRTPDAIVGDGDSMTREFAERHRDIVHIVREQEYNDLTKSTRHVMSRLAHIKDRRPRVAYLGCVGKREDHTLGNISLMAFYLREFGIDPYMFTDYGVFMAVSGRATFESAPGVQVSIFNVDSEHLTSEGLRWRSYPYREWWQGTLNECVGDSFTIDADGTYIVYVTYEAKVVTGTASEFSEDK